RERLAIRQHVDQRALRKGAMPDVAAAGTAKTANLTHAIRREVVVMDVALARRRRDRVETLLLGNGAKRRNRQHLRLTTREDRRTVRARQVPNLGPDRADLGVRSSVRANTILKDAVAHLFLQEGFVRSADIAGRKARRLTLCRAAQRRNGLLLEVTGGFEPNHLVRVAHGLAKPVTQERPELVVELLVALRRLERPLLLANFSNELVLQLDDLADVLVRHLDGLNHLLFRDLDGLALDHHDGVIGTGHHHVEHALIALEERRVDEELIVLHAHADRANGTFPRNR